MEVQVSFPLYFDEKKPTIEEYKRHVIAGTPDECIERVQEYVDIGVTQFMLWFLDLPSIEGIRLFADHVIPTF